MRIQRTARGIAVGVLPPPVDFGSPAKYTSWRTEQEEALVLLSESTKRFSFLNMPTGSGKTLLAYMYCVMTGQRGLILTETKGLADQYCGDVGEKVGGKLVDIRGANNYPCPALLPGGQYSGLREGVSARSATCDVGPCKSGMSCKLRQGGCPFYDQQRTAMNADVVVTNYANWMALGKAMNDEDDERLGEFDVIFLDECHAADTQTSNALTVEIPLFDVRQFFGSYLMDPPRSDDIRGWTFWLDSLKRMTAMSMERVRSDIVSRRDAGLGVSARHLKDMRLLRRLQKSLVLLDAINEDTQPEDWVIEQTEWHGRKKVMFQPVFPAPYCEKYLFRGVKKIVGMSATIYEDYPEYLGLKRDQYDYWEFDSSFPPENSPIYVLPVAFMKYDMRESDKERVVHVLDNIAKMHNGEKGIIHTVSYERARYYANRSKWKSRVLENTPDSTARTVERFHLSDGDEYLVSPSVGTGYDFADDHCRWQVIMKVPFPDARSKLIEKRKERDKNYASRLAAIYLAQAAGRSTRSQEDWSTIYITDAVFWEWYKQNIRMFAKWFRDRIKRVSSIPKRIGR